MIITYQDFYKANYARAYRWVYSELKDKDEAYDLVAEIFCTMLQKFDAIENHERYLNSAIYNAIKNYHGSKASKRKHQPLDDIDPNIFAIMESEERPNQQLNHKALEIFNKIMLESDDLTREIFKARLMGKVTPTEVQSIYKISYPHYNKILDTTRNKILDLLRSYEQ